MLGLKLTMLVKGATDVPQFINHHEFLYGPGYIGIWPAYLFAEFSFLQVNSRFLLSQIGF